MDNSTHLSSADSDASPLHSLQVQNAAEELTNEHVYSLKETDCKM